MPENNYNTMQEETTLENPSTQEDTTQENVAEATSADTKSEEISVEEQLRQEVADLKDKYVRLMAEFENFKRRTARERIDNMKTAGQDIIKDLLPVLDDLHRAEKSLSSSTDIEAVKEGFFLIKDKLLKNLAHKGLQPMESIGEVFNADTHEAVTEIPAPTDEMKGKVIDELEKGYTLNEKIIRYAKVVVGK
jgi:molecular chaperone GrpE